MKKFALFLCFVLIISFCGCEFLLTDESYNHNQSTLDGTMIAYFFDVGQADCSLYMLPNGKTMLIDAGNNSDGLLISDFLKQKGVDTIDYLVLTHPHEDHIGGADILIKNFDLGEVYMPKIKESLIPTTKTYEEVLDSLIEKGVSVNAATSGTVIFDDESLSAVCLSPYNSYSELNHYSIVVRLDYGETSFLLTGDAEAINEKEMQSANCDLDVDILKVGHHGSNYSTTVGFLNEVTPDYAVISVGEGNRYDHPNDTVIERLYKHGAQMVYRTDLNGTVIVETDGKEHTLKTDENIMLDGGR